MHIFPHNSVDRFNPRQLNQIILQSDRNRILVRFCAENFGNGARSVQRPLSIFSSIDRNLRLKIKDKY